MPMPTIGRIVHYQLSEGDAAAINASREKSGVIANRAREGAVYPATVVATFGGTAANLQVTLDGPDTYWATSRSEGTNPGSWAWPPRV